jgi:hypothetical protein
VISGQWSASSFRLYWPLITGNWPLFSEEHLMTKHLKEVDRLQKIVEAFPKVTITVLGDLVADEFVYGEISRVSREAPVLILKHRERTVVPGGGANAVNNLADLGVNVLPVGEVFSPQADSGQRRSQR